MRIQASFCAPFFIKDQAGYKYSHGLHFTENYIIIYILFSFMNIWKYTITRRENDLEIFWRRTCLFCETELYLIPKYALNFGKEVVLDWWRSSLYIGKASELSYALCLICGWWNAFETQYVEDQEEWRGITTTLKEFDLTDLKLPLDEVQNYLLARYKARFSIHPRLDTRSTDEAPFSVITCSFFCDVNV